MNAYAPQAVSDETWTQTGIDQDSGAPLRASLDQQYIATAAAAQRNYSHDTDTFGCDKSATTNLADPVHFSPGSSLSLSRLYLLV